MIIDLYGCLDEKVFVPASVFDLDMTAETVLDRPDDSVTPGDVEFQTKPSLLVFKTSFHVLAILAHNLGPLAIPLVELLPRSRNHHGVFFMLDAGTDLIDPSKGISRDRDPILANVDCFLLRPLVRLEDSSLKCRHFQ